MNEYTRVGKGDTYVEVCTNWEENIIPIIYMFKECIGEHMSKELLDGIKEVFSLEEYKE